MNQSLDLIGSYILGGIVVLALVGLTLSYNGKTQETKLSEIAQYNTEETGKIIENDFDKLGYRVSGSKIIRIDSSSITFMADLDNNGNADSVTYSTMTQNQKLFLSRRVAGAHTNSWSIPVQRFSINGIDSTGAATFNITSIKGISVSLTTNKESNARYAIGAFWQRKFFPKNL
ncbi:MAG: hypothetical protein M1480_02020 [Bacteroidetes bacterium]|nr:hypothetical protein [Bacteroidota bacterium]